MHCIDFIRTNGHNIKCYIKIVVVIIDISQYEEQQSVIYFHSP